MTLRTDIARLKREMPSNERPFAEPTREDWDWIVDLIDRAALSTRAPRLDAVTDADRTRWSLLFPDINFHTFARRLPELDDEC